MMGQLEYGPALRAAALACGMVAAVGAAAAEGQIYRVVGVEEGKTAHMRSRPSHRARPVGYVPGGARAILVRPCLRNWCRVRYKKKTGWVSRSLLKPEIAEAGARTLSGEGHPFSRQEETGPVEALLASPESAPAEAVATPGTYVIAGVAAGAMLELREAPADGARVIGAVPRDAREVEALGQSVKKWRHVRYHGVSGWILGRHLAEAGASGQHFRVAGVSMLESVAVREHPDAEAASVGSIPSYASGIVAIGACDARWCHIRYLGLVGWVERRFLEPLVKRRG
jgi:SH3-like domain-containing protein